MATTTATSPVTTTPQLPYTTRARRWLRRMFQIVFIGGFLAAIWDGIWHLTVAFDGFWSPPHVFGYTVALIGAGILTYITFHKHLRRPFGVGFRVPFIAFEVPGSLFLLGAGFVILGLAGVVLDNYWHSTYGLNETNWSAPHAMIGWGLLVITLGFLSARLALARTEGKPMPLGWKVAFAILVIMMSGRPFMGPLEANNSPATVIATSRQPGLMATPEYQQVLRIYLEHNLTRANPALLPLAALWGGVVFALIRRMDARPLFVIGIALLMSGGSQGEVERLGELLPGLTESRANYASLPLVVLPLTFYLLRLVRVPERWSWGIAGALFALCVHWIFGYDVPGIYLLAIPAGILTVIGVRVGEAVYRRLEQPDTFRRVAPILIAAVVVPLLTGLLDLYYRSVTP